MKEVPLDVRFVFITINHDKTIIAAALSIAAVGYVRKHSPVSELPQAVAAVLQGCSYPSGTPGKDGQATDNLVSVPPTEPSLNRCKPMFDSQGRYRNQDATKYMQNNYC